MDSQTRLYAARHIRNLPGRKPDPLQRCHSYGTFYWLSGTPQRPSTWLHLDLTKKGEQFLNKHLFFVKLSHAGGQKQVTSHQKNLFTRNTVLSLVYT